MLKNIKDFFELEAASGIVLLAASVLALVLANSPYAGAYHAGLAPWHFAINDVLMVFFFLLVGLEIKREFIEGELSARAQAALPLVAALGGVVTPAIIYSALNWNTDAMRGWAIPTATDIAFSLAVLALLGSRIAPSLKVFLMAVAIIDDLVAVIIIAVFYTAHLSPVALIMAAGCLIILWGLNRCVKSLWPYLLTGVALWVTVAISGVHPTVTGVALAWMIPLPAGKKLMEKLHPYVAYGVMPIFAFANAGIPLSGVSLAQLSHPVPLGIALGLFLGKQLGIFTAAWLFIRCGFARLPTGARWPELYAVCMIAGIGFTMSLFIGTLAFGDEAMQFLLRLGVIIGSLLSALIGYMVLAHFSKNRP